MKSYLIKLFRLYFVPFPFASKLYFKIKDIYYTYPGEHLYRFLTLSKSKWSNSAENVLLDIGAADGLTSVFFIDKVAKSKVYAFEPNERIWPVLDRNTKNKPAIQLKKIGLGEKSEIAQFHVTDNNLSSSFLETDSAEIDSLPQSHQQLLRSAGSKQASISTLDVEMKDLPDILCIKLDVQGYELKILKGGEETLKKTHFVIVEMSNHQLYKGGCQYYEIDAFLRSRNFKLADIIVSYRTLQRVQEYDAIYEKIA